MEYTTKDGEKLDAICFKRYGYTNTSFENVLYEPKNYDLTTFDVFSACVTIALPYIQPASKNTATSLWD
jgi:phage tail protein X